MTIPDGDRLGAAGAEGENGEKREAVRRNDM